MSEYSSGHELAPTSEVIADGLDYWLMKEVGQSTVGNNKILDDFTDWRKDLLLPYEDTSNGNAGKNRGHYSQVIDWTAGLIEYYPGLTEKQADYMLARQIFRAQMYLSGLFRVHCFLVATDQDDYSHRRLELEHVGLDIDAQSAVNDRLHDIFGYMPGPEEFEPRLNLEEVTQRTLQLNEEQREYVRELHRSGRNDVGKEASPTIDTILSMEHKWVSHVTDYVAFIASERQGKLAAVPFLEPRSISTDPQPYYPFAELA